MNKNKEWEQAWLDGQSYYWTSLIDWSEFAGEVAKNNTEDDTRIGNTNKERWDSAVAVPPLKK